MSDLEIVMQWEAFGDVTVGMISAGVAYFGLGLLILMFSNRIGGHYLEKREESMPGLIKADIAVSVMFIIIALVLMVVVYSL